MHDVTFNCAKINNTYFKKIFAKVQIFFEFSGYNL